MICATRLQKKHQKEAERLQAAVKQLSKEFKKMSADAEAKRGDDARLLDGLDAAKAAVADAEAAVAAGGFDAEALKELQRQHAAKASEVQNYEVCCETVTIHVTLLLSSDFQ